MRVLVTGTNGLVGRGLCQQLFQRGLLVRVAVRSAESASQEFESISVGALDDQTHWQAALLDINTVVHLAARVHVMHERVADPLAEFRRVNVQGTLNLARQAAAGVKRFVFLSSIKVNGESTLPGLPLTETDTPNPQDAYAQSKHEAEQGLRQIAAQTGLEVVIIRQRGWPLPLGSINNARSLVALDNLVDFIILCCTHPEAAHQTFMISDGQDLSTAQLVRGIAAAANMPDRLLPIPIWMLKLAGHLTGKSQAVQRLCGNLQVDISKAQHRLGWVPVTTVPEGLHKLFEGEKCDEKKF